MARSHAVLFGLLIAGAALAAPEKPAPEGVITAAAPRVIADFTLTDQNGKPWRFSRLKGQPALIFFGFARCPDVCPTTLFKLAQVQKATPRKLAGLRIVMVSVDGDRDTPEILKSYLERFSSRFIGLTGPPATVAKIAAQFPAVFFKGIASSPGGDYTVQHTSDVYGVDAQGRVRVQFKDATVQSMIAAMLAD